MSTLSPIGESRLTTLVHEFNSVIREFCAAFETPKVKNLADIIKYNKDHSDVAMPARKLFGEG